MKQLQPYKFTNNPVLSVIAFQRQTVLPRRTLASHIPESEANEVITLFVPAIGPWIRATAVRHRPVCYSGVWLKYDAHALEGSKRGHDTKNDTSQLGKRRRTLS
jgi:hypothetical protein